MSTPSSAGATANPVSALNIHSVSTFIPTFDGSFPVQDFIQEVSEAAKLGTWTDNITLKVAKSKLHGPVADMVRNREDLNHAPTFEVFFIKTHFGSAYRKTCICSAPGPDDLRTASFRIC